MNEIREALAEMYGRLGVEAFAYVVDLDLSADDKLRLGIGYCELADADDTYDAACEVAA